MKNLSLFLLSFGLSCFNATSYASQSMPALKFPDARPDNQPHATAVRGSMELCSKYEKMETRLMIEREKAKTDIGSYLANFLYTHDINARCKAQGHTLLMVAVQRRSGWPLLKELINHRADVNIKDNVGVTALGYAIAFYPSNWHIDVLVERSSEENLKESLALAQKWQQEALDRKDSYRTTSHYKDYTLYSYMRCMCTHYVRSRIQARSIEHARTFPVLDAITNSGDQIRQKIYTAAQEEFSRFHIVPERASNKKSTQEQLPYTFVSRLGRFDIVRLDKKVEPKTFTFKYGPQGHSLTLVQSPDLVAVPRGNDLEHFRQPKSQQSESTPPPSSSTSSSEKSHDAESHELQPHEFHIRLVRACSPDWEMEYSNRATTHV